MSHRFRFKIWLFFFKKNQLQFFSIDEVTLVICPESKYVLIMCLDFS